MDLGGRSLPLRGADRATDLIVKAALGGCRGRQSGVTNILVPRDRTQLATCPGHLRKNVKASSADIVLLGTPSPGPRVNTLM